MKLFALSVLALTGLLTVFPLWAASHQDDDSSNFLHDPALLSRNDSRMSGTRFLTAWMAKDNAQEQLKANMYLLGVMDATEGKVWCSYNIALAGSLRESVYDYFKKLPAERKKEQAATLIAEALAQDLPCRKGERQ